MSSTIEAKRALGRRSEAPQASTPLRRILGSPAALVATAVILLALFVGTFIVNSGGVAATKNPAYYRQRTELMTTETPETLLDTMAWITESPAIAAGAVMFMRARRPLVRTS